MLFSSLIFLYAFLPIALASGWFLGRRLQNYVLFILSLVFYAWGGVSYTAIVLISILFNYVAGIVISRQVEQKRAKIWLLSFVTGNLLLLVYIKYTGFFIENINHLLAWFNANPVKDPDVELIPGISFFTFHSISYLTDIYRKDSSVQKNFGIMGLYIIFFPQLIAGPIIRYHEIEDQFTSRKLKRTDIIEGINRFIIGVTKKIIFSDTFAVPADKIFSSDINLIDTPMAWFGILCYTLHIYCDFSGYSDMAIGLARMFGFTFPENFNFPYIASSVQDFWRRWHMTLSRWFRDYVYIPIGGNKKGAIRTIVNLFIVFFLTGFWHGASWTMVIWGLFHGFFLVMERLFLGKWLPKLYVFKHVYTLLVVMIAWVFFKSPDLPFATGFIQKLFEFSVDDKLFMNKPGFFMNNEFQIIFYTALLFVFRIPHLLKGLLLKSEALSGFYLALQPLKYLFLLLLLFVCTVFMISHGYSPFIYYQF